MIGPYFEKLAEQVVCQIKKARQEVLIAVAWITNEEIIEALRSLGNDIALYVVVRRRNNKYWMQYRQIYEIVSQHAEGGFYVAKGKDLHDKFCVIDNNVVLTGSYNWTQKGELDSWDNLLVVEDREVARRYAEHFRMEIAQISERIKSPGKIEVALAKGALKERFTPLHEREGVPRLHDLQVLGTAEGRCYIRAHYTDSEHIKPMAVYIQDDTYIEIVKGLVDTQKTVLAQDLPQPLVLCDHIFGDNHFRLHQSFLYSNNKRKPFFYLVREWENMKQDYLIYKKAEVESFVRGVLESAY